MHSRTPIDGGDYDVTKVQRKTLGDIMWSTKTVESSDPDEFVTLIRRADPKLLVTERGQFAARGTLIDIGKLQAQRRDERLSRVLQVEVSRPGILFHTEPGPDMFLNGARIRQGEIALFSSGEAYVFRLSGPTSWGAMTLDDNDMNAVRSSYLGCRSTRMSGFSIMTPPSATLARLRKLHAIAGNLEDFQESPLQIEFGRELEQSLIMAMVGGMGPADTRPDTVGRQHHQLIIRRFFEVLEAKASEPSDMQAISEATGVSSRSLRLACQEQLGVSPTQYMLLRRMRLVRRALKQADPDSTRVTDIATEFGFWELGRFAVKFRQIFGESPSATLRSGTQLVAGF
jgi:AraC-like DNA-binding protein